MAKRLSILVSLDGNDQGLQRTVENAQKSLNDLASSAKGSGAKISDGITDMKSGFASLNSRITEARTQLLAFLSVHFALDTARRVVEIADSWNMMTAKLKLATAGQSEFNVAQKALFDLAQRNGVALESTATLYGKMQASVRSLGKDQTVALSLTESVAQALRLSGATSSEASSSILQFGQALSAGVLRGDEFNSVMENSPRLAQALAEGLNAPIGSLRKMAEQGQLTADVVVNALLSQKQKLATEFGQLPMTVSQSMERVRNAFTQWISEVDQATGFTTKLAEAFTWLSQHVDDVMQVLGVLSKVTLAILIYRLIPALITAWRLAGLAAVSAATNTSAAWATANLTLSQAAATAGLLKTAFALLGAFVVGWEIGTWLREKFEVVRVAGVVMVEGLVKGFEVLQYQWELFAAVFSSDTLAAASQRHQQRLQQMNDVLTAMRDDARDVATSAASAMNASGMTAQEISRNLEAVRQGTQEAVGRGLEAVSGAIQKLGSQITEVDQRIGQLQSTVSQTTSRMASAYSVLISQVSEQLMQQLSAVTNFYAQKKNLLDLHHQSEVLLITQSTQLLSQSIKDQVALKRSALTQTLSIMNEEALIRRQVAERQGANDAERLANVRQVDNEILETKRRTLQEAVADYRQHIDELNAQDLRHLQSIERIEAQKRQLSLSTEDRIREIQRQGMSEAAANEDRKLQIQQRQQAAKEALSRGELEQAKKLAQESMDLAAQVASEQASQTRQSQNARIQSEQELSKVQELQSQARQARSNQEYERSEQLMKQADELRESIAEKTKVSDEQVARGKSGISQSIQSIQSAQDILNQTLDAEAAAHRKASLSAQESRNAIQQTIDQTTQSITSLTATLQKGLTISLSADATQFKQTLAQLDQSLDEKARLVAIQLDLKAAQKQLQDFEQQLKDGKTMSVNLDLSSAVNALSTLQTYAKEKSLIELSLSTDKAQASLNNLSTQMQALSRLRSESLHEVRSNVETVRSSITSLQGLNTSSVHTITIQKVEAHASGGLVGSGGGRGDESVARFSSGGLASHDASSHSSVNRHQGVAATIRRFATGGMVMAGVNFRRLKDGFVPGSGNEDTEAHALDQGSFVINKNAVRQYGASAMAALNEESPQATTPQDSKKTGSASSGTSHQRTVSTNQKPVSTESDIPQEGQRVNRSAYETIKMIELGLKSMDDYTAWLQTKFSGAISLDARRLTLTNFFNQSRRDKPVVEALLSRAQLSSTEQQTLDRIRSTWKMAISQPLQYGKDVERELMDWMAAQKVQFFKSGGLAASDVVPAMLTPGEYVVKKSAVERWGVGFLESLNRMKLPAQAVMKRVRGYANGGFVQHQPWSHSVNESDWSRQLPKQDFSSTSGPIKTIRVELTNGFKSVPATMAASDESQLMQLLAQAKSRSI